MIDREYVVGKIEFGPARILVANKTVTPKPPNITDVEKLTPEQIENWRNILCSNIGPYAWIMSDDDIQKYRDAMQLKINRQEAG